MTDNWQMTDNPARRLRAMRDASNAWFDRRVRVVVRLRTFTVSAFHLCGVTGFILASITGAALIWLRGLHPWVLAVLTGSSVTTFLVLAMATKIIKGTEELVYYRHEIAIAAVASCVAWSLRLPILDCIEITVLGVGAFLSCGRIGCFLVGCCHGCPHSFGVRYRDEHAEEGFPEPLLGVRLFPVQLLEALLVAAIVAIGVGMVWHGAASGEALAWYSISYGMARFGLEFLRGDSARPYYGSFSEAQWFTFALLILTTAAELAGTLPLEGWHVAVTAALALFMATWGATDGSLRRLFRPAHVQELAALLKAAERRGSEPDAVSVSVTRIGLRLSACKVFGPAASSVDTVAFSAADSALEPLAATKLARLLSRLKGKPGQLIEGHSGVYHLVFAEEGVDHGV